MAADVNLTAGSVDEPWKNMTYLFSRLSLPVLVVALGIAVVLESQRRDEVLGSISAYYYTAAGPVFVATLVTIGVSLIALQGNTELEDTLLNLAGMLAPVVALVPTPDDAPRGQATVDQVVNNLTSFIVAGYLAWVIALVVMVRTRRAAGASGLTKDDVVGFALGLIFITGGLVWLKAGEESFLDYAHKAAAFAMFIFIALAVAGNTCRGAKVLVWMANRLPGGPDAGRDRWIPGPHWVNKVYGAVLAGMLLVQLTWIAVGSFDQTVFTVEAVMITLFAVFWILQTLDLRHTTES